MRIHFTSQELAPRTEAFHYGEDREGHELDRDDYQQAIRKLGGFLKNVGVGGGWEIVSRAESGVLVIRRNVDYIGYPPVHLQIMGRSRDRSGRLVPIEGLLIRGGAIGWSRASLTEADVGWIVDVTLRAAAASQRDVDLDTLEGELGAASLALRSASAPLDPLKRLLRRSRD